MNTQWFLGANTGDGFLSRFEQLQNEPQIQKLIILKGGPGCGKSTFMKKLQKIAARFGADTCSYPCSSDPASLDGLFIPSLGFAVVDGTAPHVLEPRLCCCDGVYLNLGCFYDAEGVAGEKETLELLRKKNQALYPAVYTHLAAARELNACARTSMKIADQKGLYTLTRALLQELSPSKKGQGRTREVFLHAYTPAGELFYEDTLRSLCPTTVGIEDCCGLSAPLLQRLCGHYQHAGYDCILALSPLSAELLEGLLIPEAGIAYYACEAPSPSFCVTIQLSNYYNKPECYESLRDSAKAHCRDAVNLLKQAKLLHDKIEAVYRPHVSFEGLDLLTQEYEKMIKAELLAKAEQ